MFKTYYQLTKPGIIYGNLVTTTAGFLLAARGHVYYWLLLNTLLSISLIIASACVFNNYIDRSIDQKMARTKNRALASGRVSSMLALIYAGALGVAGFVVLGLSTNALTVYLGFIAIVVYVILYGVAKRRTVHSTVIGSVAGALPPVAGYTAYTHHLDGAAGLLFLLMVCWQMPHFYAIAVYRLKDYKTAGLPVLPVKYGLNITKRYIVMYIFGFIIASSLLTLLGYTGISFLIIMVLVGLVWLRLAIKGFWVKEDATWARQLFVFSLIVTLTMSVMLSIGGILP